MFKKLAVVALLCCSFSLTAFGETRDWEGTFSVVDSKGNTQTVTHEPHEVSITSVNMGTMSAGGCISFAGARLCSDSTIETFTTEAGKLGSIVSKVVTPGPTYSSN